jgi:hypothetical protein
MARCRKWAEGTYRGLNVRGVSRSCVVSGSARGTSDRCPGRGAKSAIRDGLAAARAKGGLRATAQRGWAMRGPRCRAARLEIVKPGFDSGLAKAPVSAEANMWDPSGARLGPDPLGLHTEPLGEFVSCQQPFHPRPPSVGDGADDRVPGADPHGVVGARVPFGAAAGARWPTGVASLFVVAMTLGSEKRACLEVLDASARIS